MNPESIKSDAILISTSAEQTRALGARLATALAPGDIIGLTGELGAGKTVFVQGLAQALGAPQAATSPTFVLAHTYPGRVPLVHMDLYRLNSAQAEELGLDDYLKDAAGVIEWADRLRGLDCDLMIEISFSPASVDGRELLLYANSARGRVLLVELTKKSRLKLTTQGDQE
jgi:tRNA threonylcarbamoyladenosine biosynthesis protein TsaE